MHFLIIQFPTISLTSSSSPSSSSYSHYRSSHVQSGNTLLITSLPQVRFRSGFIMNGVCVCCKGWLDLDKLEGIACLEYDPERAAREDANRRELVERYRQHCKQFYPIDKSIVHTRPINDKPEQSDSVSDCTQHFHFP